MEQISSDSATLIGPTALILDEALEDTPSVSDLELLPGAFENRRL